MQDLFLLAVMLNPKIEGNTVENQYDKMYYNLLAPDLPTNPIEIQKRRITLLESRCNRAKGTRKKQLQELLNLYKRKLALMEKGAH